MFTWQAVISEDLGFSSFSQQHFWVMLMFLFSLAGVIWAGLQFGRPVNHQLSRGLSLVLPLTIVAWTALKLSLGTFNPVVDLPLNPCNLIALLAPLIFWTPNLQRFEIVYFLVMAGTLQAFLTPDLYQGFPSFTFFKYWIVHGGVILIVVHHFLAFRLYPRLKGILTTFLCINLYAAVLYLINLWLGANYLYLINKPGNPSILDYFGPWPVYIFYVEVLAVILFALLYLPVLLFKKYFPPLNHSPQK